MKIKKSFFHILRRKSTTNILIDQKNSRFFFIFIQKYPISLIFFKIPINRDCVCAQKAVILQRD